MGIRPLSGYKEDAGSNPDNDVNSDGRDNDSIGIATAATTAATTTATATANYVLPWSLPHFRDRSLTLYAWFGQQVNLLTWWYCKLAEPPNRWPNLVYNNPTLPLFLDDRCGKVGFSLRWQDGGGDCHDKTTTATTK